MEVGRDNEEWVGVYFRLPKSEKEAFLDAVTKVYGPGKGAVSKALRDLVKDFIELASSGGHKELVGARAVGKIIENYLTEEAYDYTPLHSSAVWKTYEALLKILWSMHGEYPRIISLREFYTIIKQVRGGSRPTLNKWRKELAKAGLIEVLNKKVIIHYPVVDAINTVEDFEKEKIHHNFEFALVSPALDDFILVYPIKIVMNPPHIALITLRVNSNGKRIEHKTLMPYTVYMNDLEMLIRKEENLTAKGVRKVLNLFVTEHNWEYVPAEYLKNLHEALIKIGVEDAPKLLGVPAL